jgi:hypothetical protein
MASTYSPNLRLELIGTGDQQGTWGATTNTNLGTLLEEAIGGYTSVTVSDVADTTLTTNNGSADQSRNAVINLTGTISAARNVICPAIEKVYIVRNATTGGYGVTFKVSGQTGVSIPNGSTYLLYVNGTDAVAVTGTMASQLASAVAITGGSIVANASSLSVRDSDGSHVLTFAVGSNLTSNTTLTLTTGTSNRTLDISSANVTISTAGAALIDDADASAQRTTLGLGTIATQNSNNVSITGGSVTGITDLAVADGGTGASDASTARTNLGIGTIGTQNANNVTITGGSITGITDLAVADGGTGASDASGARTNLGLGTISTQNANNVTITGGSISGITDLAVADGGTGASDASTARTNLGLGSIATQNANNVTITGGSVTGIADITVADGGTGTSSFTAYSVVVGGTTSTGPLQTVASVGTSGQVLTSAGAGAIPTWSTISSGGALIRAPQILTSGTSYTTPSNCNTIYVEAVGGGGGGGGTTNNSTGPRGGGGGGGGGYCAKYFTVTPSTAYIYAIGTGGAGGVNGTGTAGGNTTFTVGGTTITATGGAGGSGSSGGAAAGGLGGLPTNGDLNVRGGPGGQAIDFNGTIQAAPGGSSFFGPGARGGSAADSYGGGGSGISYESPFNRTGYAGYQGMIRIWEFT